MSFPCGSNAVKAKASWPDQLLGKSKCKVPSSKGSTAGNFPFPLDIMVKPSPSCNGISKFNSSHLNEHCSRLVKWKRFSKEMRPSEFGDRLFISILIGE